MSPGKPPIEAPADWRQPTLDSDRLHLRPLVPDDWRELYAVASDPLIWAQHPAWDRGQEDVFRVFFDEGLALRGAVTVIDRATGAIVGSSRWHGHDPARSTVEIGWTFLARRYWGTGYNRELKRLMLAHAFAHVATVTFHVGADNIRSRKAVEAIGGVLTDQTEVAMRAGNPVLHVIYAITRESFARGPLGSEA